MTRSKRVALVFAGGASRRMGSDKASLPFGPESMLERVVRLVSPEVDRIIVIARAGQAVPPGMTVLEDREEFEGPLAALVRGMEGTPADRYLVTVCDQPLLVPALIPLLFRRLGAAHAAVPLVSGRLVPTFAVYRHNTLNPARALLEAGERRLSALAQAVDTAFVEEADLRTLDPDLRTFLPCNTPAEYRRLLALAGI